MFEMSQEYFDSRDLIERLGELQELEGIVSAGEASPEEVAEWEGLEDEYNLLRNFADGAEVNCEDWVHGETFIREDCFTQHMKELVADIGYIPRDLPSWIEDNIDWDGVADDLRDDYNEYELDGNTYYAR